MNETEFARIPELAKELGIPASRLYEESRFNRLPGQTRLGKYVLVERKTFFEALRRGDLAKKEIAA